MGKSKMRNQHELTEEQKEIRKRIIAALDGQDSGDKFLNNVTEYINAKDFILYITEAMKSYDESIDSINMIMTDDQERYINLFKITQEQTMMRINSNPIYSFYNKSSDFGRVRKGEIMSSEVVGKSMKVENKAVIKYPLFVYTQLLTVNNNYKALNIIIYNSKFRAKNIQVLDDGFEINEITINVYKKERKEDK